MTALPTSAMAIYLSVGVRILVHELGCSKVSISTEKQEANTSQ